jgi:hypothetical protein
MKYEWVILCIFFAVCAGTEKNLTFLMFASAFIEAVVLVASSKHKRCDKHLKSYGPFYDLDVCFYYGAGGKLILFLLLFVKTVSQAQLSYLVQTAVSVVLFQLMAILHNMCTAKV